MQIRSNFLLLSLVFTALLTDSLISYSQVKDKQSLSLPLQNLWVTAQTVNIASLANGNYQLCSQPDPQDWRDGAGVCLNFSKVENRVDGYYGYPHSDHFICIRGIVNGNHIIGEALAISWGVNLLKNTPESAFTWDSEGRLTVSQGRVVSTTNDSEDAAKWILYRNASLDIQGFYQYSFPRMSPTSQLCDWELK
ncbi:hypothetical protein WKK05_01795 [Nostoc sp. UHCC 0302]|uniref:hypothetical protein n=1 Tax=Nostoc sp. UHCC 0302 TaxID=3134896 RepID=UPI00311CD55F